MVALLKRYMVPTIFFDFRFQDITGLSWTFLKDFKEIFLQIPGQSRAHFIYLEKLQDIQGQQRI